MDVEGPRSFPINCCTGIYSWLGWCFAFSWCSYSQPQSDDDSGQSQGFQTNTPSIASPSRSSPSSDRLSLLPKATELNSSSNVWSDGKPSKWHAEAPLKELRKDKMGDLVKGYPSGISIAPSDEGETCSTCLEPYTLENPAIWTKCNHHFHLACIYEWLERKQTCPICEREMSFEEILE